MQLNAYDPRWRPAKYLCTVCGAAGVKLWREYNTASDLTALYCAVCALKNQTRDLASAINRTDWKIDAQGYHRDANGIRSDQIGWLVPAVPTVEQDTYWGYTSVPPDGVAWWRAMPTALL